MFYDNNSRDLFGSSLQQIDNGRVASVSGNVDGFPSTLCSEPNIKRRDASMVDMVIGRKLCYTLHNIM